MPSETDWSEYLARSLAKLDEMQLRRRRVVSEVGDAEEDEPIVYRSGQQLINFGANDYLGLRHHSDIIQAAQRAIVAGGVGSGASPAVTGYSRYQQKLEKRLADWHATEDGLVFTSGFAGNVATLSSLVGTGDVVFCDALNHASLIDGCRMSNVRRIVYAHNDVAHLRQMLTSWRHQFKRALIVTESIFSMDGDAAPLAAIADTADEFQCGIVVDEAHATGIYGPKGSGLVEELGLSKRIFAKLGTLSKAMGCLGGYLCGASNLVEHVLNHGRSYMFSTALPGSVMAAALVATERIEWMTAERTQLRQRARWTRDQLSALGWKVLGEDSPIIPVVLGEKASALKLSQRLAEAGFYVPAIRPPTVPRGTSRLRISLSHAHSIQHLDALITALGDAQ